PPSCIGHQIPVREITLFGTRPDQNLRTAAPPPAVEGDADPDLRWSHTGSCEFCCQSCARPIIRWSVQRTVIPRSRTRPRVHVVAHGVHLIEFGLASRGC